MQKDDTNNAAERFIVDIKIIQREYYAKQMAEQIKQRMEAKAAEGLFMGRPPIGYSPTKTRGLYKPNATGKALGVVLGAFAEGNVDLGTAKRLVRELIESHQGRSVSQSTVTRLILNPYYSGYFVWSGKGYKGKHKAVITHDQYHEILLRIKVLPEKSKG